MRKLLRNSKAINARWFSSDSFMSGNSALYIEQMYQKWAEDRTSVHASWDSYFTNIANGVGAEDAFSHVPGHAVNLSGLSDSASADKASYSSVLRLFLLVRSFRNRGHAVADLDPLSTLIIFFCATQ